MKLRCRSHTIVRNLVLSIIFFDFLLMLPSDLRIENKLSPGMLTNFGPVSVLFQKPNACIEQQFVPSPGKSFTRPQSRAHDNLAAHPHRNGRDETWAETKGVPITVSLKNDHQAFLLLDLPPPIL